MARTGRRTPPRRPRPAGRGDGAAGSGVWREFRASILGLSPSSTGDQGQSISPPALFVGVVDTVVRDRRAACNNVAAGGPPALGTCLRRGRPPNKLHPGPSTVSPRKVLACRTRAARRFC